MAGNCAISSLPRAIAMTCIAGSLLCGCARVTPPLPPPPTPVTISRPPRPVLAPAAHLVNASWYGPGLDGHPTATGETYNSNELTAASKSLPLGCIVRVTNPENGKSVNVRINDRGPFVRGRSLDLSHRAAKKIGIINSGVARVKVVRLLANPSPGDHDLISSTDAD